MSKEKVICDVLIISIYDSGYYWSIQENLGGARFNYDREDYSNGTIENEDILKLAKYVDIDDMTTIKYLILNDLYSKYDLVYICSDGCIDLVKDLRIDVQKIVHKEEK